MLSGLKERGLRLAAIDFKIHEDTFRGTVSQHIGKGLGVDLNVDVFGALSVNNGRNVAFTTHLLEDTRSGAIAGFSFKSLGLRHGLNGLIFQRWVPRGAVGYTEGASMSKREVTDFPL